MKKIHFIPLIFNLLLPLVFIGQTGPGGIGNSSTLEVWLDASQLSLSDNDPVSNWLDLSTNTNHLNQPTSLNQPTFKASGLNSKPTVVFDGVNDYLDFTAEITTGAVSMITVYKSQNPLNGVVMALNKHALFSKGDEIFNPYTSPTQYNLIKNKINEFGIVTITSTGGATSGTLGQKTITASRTLTRTAFANYDTSSVGMRKAGGNYSFPLNGEIAEIIIYNNNISDVESVIARTYLASKYDLPILNNFYKWRTTYNNEVIGVGFFNGQSSNSARGRGNLLMSNATSLNIQYDFLNIGHDNAGFGTNTSVPSGTIERWNQTWRVNRFQNPGNIDLEFFLEGNEFAVNPNNYAILIETNDGNFTNGGTRLHTTGLIYNAINNSIKFTGVNLPDGAYFTLAEVNGTYTAISDNDWNNPLTWSCNCVPTQNDDVTIPSPRTVLINGASSFAKNVTIETGATIAFNTNDSLYVSGNLTNSGTIDASTGLIAFTGIVNQELRNNSATPVSFFNVFVNNSNSVTLKSGAWELKTYIKISSGQLINDGGTFTFISDATTNAQIEQSVSNSFVGNFIMQRYFSTRPANYADLTTPVQSTTIDDWDQELFMSGVGGNDGDARDGSGGPIFYSVTKYNNTTKAYRYVTSIAEPLIAGEGVELFLGDNLTTFSAQTIDHRGTPFTGTRSFTLQPGMNFIGNPHYSFVNFNSVSKPTGVTSQFYIYEQSSGSYRLFNGGFIPHSQGFWVNNSSGTSKTLNIGESNKFSLASSLIYRQKEEKEFKLLVKSLGNNYSHELSLHTSATANYGSNENDAPFLESPLKSAPAITLVKGSIHMVHSTINTFSENQKIPVAFTAGENGSYTIAAKDVSELLSIYSCVLLEDKMEGKVIDLNSTADYTFASTIGKYDRFNLHLFKSAEDCKDLLAKADQNQSANSGISILKRGDIVQLDFNVAEGSQAQIDIYNLNGQKVAATQFIGMEGAGSQQLAHTSALKGIHLIVVRTNNEVITEKFNF